MKLLVTTLYLTLLAGTFAAKSRALNSTDAAHPGKCVYNGVILSPGESGQPEHECILYICGNENYDVYIHTCYVYKKVSPPCKIGDYIDRNAAYPQCCKREIICPEGVQHAEVQLIG